jgi:hypothetical protein
MAKTAPETRPVRLRLICVTPPQTYENTLAEFGLQDKEQVLHPGHAQLDGSIVYAFDLQVQRNQETLAPRFRGPYVHGTPAAPFLYLGWRRSEAGQTTWIRRLKVPLSSITWERIEAVQDVDGGVLVARVSGTGSGTVSLLGDGWLIEDSGSSGTSPEG